MNCLTLLFLLLICGCGNCNGQRNNNCCMGSARNSRCGCMMTRENSCDCHSHNHSHSHGQSNTMNQRSDGWECEITCQKMDGEERESECSCNENAGMIPPPWVRVDDGRENQSCGCNKR